MPISLIRFAESGVGIGKRFAGNWHVDLRAPDSAALRRSLGYAAFLAFVFLATLVFAARIAAHRFFTASIIAFRPAALSLRFGFGAAALAFLTAAQRFLCASAIRLRADALNVFLFGAVGPSPAVALGRPGPRWPSCA